MSASDKKLASELPPVRRLAVKHWRAFAFLTVLIMIVGVGTSIALWKGQDLQHQINRGKSSNSKLKATRDTQIAQLIQGSKDLREELRKKGVDPDTIAPNPDSIAKQKVDQAPTIIIQKGPRGDRGPMGSRGGPGPAGSRGVSGAQGIPGPVGPAGPAGKNGAPGAIGPTGKTGPTGAPGPAGPAGDTGPQGEPGIPGTPGAQGPIGPTGPPGPSAAPGADSTVPGPQGPAGPAGPAGPKGDDATRVTAIDLVPAGPGQCYIRISIANQAPITSTDTVACP